MKRLTLFYYDSKKLYEGFTRRHYVEEAFKLAYNS